MLRTLQWARTKLWGLFYVVVGSLFIACLAWASGMNVSWAVLWLGAAGALIAPCVWSFPAAPRRVLTGLHLVGTAAMIAWSLSLAGLPASSLAVLIAIWVWCFPTRSDRVLKWFGVAAYVALAVAWLSVTFDAEGGPVWWPFPLVGLFWFLSAQASARRDFRAYESVGGQVDSVLKDAGDARRLGFDTGAAMIGFAILGVFVVVVWTHGAAEADRRARAGIIGIGGS